MYLLIIWLVLLLILLLWWKYQTPLFLARQSTTTPPNDIRKLFLEGIDDKIFQSKSLARTAQRLRQHISSKSPNSLDIEATIEKSIQAGGWFTPVSGTIKIRPEYLVLIDRTSFNDHYSELINHSIIKQLKDQDVIIKCYYFDGVPLRFYSEQSQDPPLTLTELAQAYPEHRLMVFSDGNGLINPITLKTVNWIEQFSVWSQRALFTLETPDQWGYREHILEEANFLILPANENGLKRLIERLHSGTWKPYPKPLYSFYNQFPEYIQERPRRWLEQHKPDTPVLKELLEQVQNFLGEDAYQWFSACAVYPELRWELMLYLGNQLKLFNQDSLDKLVRLPWFSYGYMPDWLREQLINDLSFSQERKIRTSLYNLFHNFTQDKPLSNFSVEFAEPQKNTLSDILEDIRSKLVKKASKNRRLDEQIFLTFMNNPLAVEVPKRILKPTFNKIFKISDLLVKFSKTSFTFLIITFFKKVKDELPGLLPLLWLILTEPNALRLRDRLKCGIENPDASILKLWFSEVKTGSIQRQYVKQFLLLLFVVIPIISLSMAYLVFGAMLGFSIEFSYWAVVLLASIAAGLLVGMFVSVPLGTVLGLLIAMIAATGVEVAESMIMIAISTGVSIAESVTMIASAGVSIAESVTMIAVSTGVSIAGSLKIRMVIGFVIGGVGSFSLVWVLRKIRESIDDDYIIYNVIHTCILFLLCLSIANSLSLGIILFIVCYNFLFFILNPIEIDTLYNTKSIITYILVGSLAGIIIEIAFFEKVTKLHLFILGGIMIVSVVVILLKVISVPFFILGLILLTGGVAGYITGYMTLSLAVSVTILIMILIVITLEEGDQIPLVLKVIGGISGCVAAGLIGIMAGYMIEGIAVGVGLNFTMLFLLEDKNYFKNNLVGFFIAIVISISAILIYNKYYYNGLMEKPESAKKVIDACIFSPGQHCVG